LAAVGADAPAKTAGPSVACRQRVTLSGADARADLFLFADGYDDTRGAFIAPGCHGLRSAKIVTGVLDDCLWHDFFRPFSYARRPDLKVLIA
jgi:hypothetical protein